jgi:hypothetical protein
MDLELATTDDIVNEFRNRGMRFVFIGAINTNIRTSVPTMVASQAVDQQDVLRLIRIGIDEIQHLDDDRIELDQEG